MQIITLAGKIHEACEMRKDKNGNNYIRFKVYCTNKDTTTANDYICTSDRCRKASFSNLYTHIRHPFGCLFLSKKAPCWESGYLDLISTI